MDSGNSGSMQSSSGGDDEYDSRAETISPFLNPSLGFGSISNHQPPPPPPPPPPLSHHQSHPPTLFDPQAQNLGAFSHSPANPNANSLYNLDLVWSRSGLRSEPMNYCDLGNFTGLSSLSSSSQSLIGLSGHSQGPFPGSSAMPLPSVDGNGGRGTQKSDQSQSTVSKNSRKRTRASRRAPTTVLTTDTSNFRQRVQEFTGIPAPPFSASPYSRRFDLFGAGPGLRSGHLEALGPLYPYRPSIQKVPPSPFVSSSSSPSLLNSAMIAPTGNIANTSNNSITTSIGGPNSFSQTMLNMQNPILTFQQFQGNSAIPSLNHELGMTHKHLNGNLSAFPSHGSSENISRWRGEEASNGGGQEHLGVFDGNNGENVNGYKLNCSASTSDFHPGKGLANVSSRNEGTVDSWICPSD